MIDPGGRLDAEPTARFFAEAETVARFHHPHVVQIYNLGEHEGRPYLELEYAEGGSLSQRRDGTPWPPPEAARLLEILARAIEAMHLLGIVHRDLKPGNILLMADGTPKIADFGLAKSLASSSTLTESGAILGTPSYMAPEQAGGVRGAVGPAVDVYALGAILYEVLTGRPPFKGATALETLEQVKGCEPVPPSRLVPRLPRDLETICLKCLEKDPARRHPSAAALAKDLRRFQAGEPIEARPVPPWERALRWARRHPAAAVTAGALAVLLVASFGQWVWSYRSIRRALDEAIEARSREAAARAAAVAESYQATLSEVHAPAPGTPPRLARSVVARARAWQPSRRRSANLEELRSEAVAGLGELDVRLVARLKQPDGILVKCLAFSPDGRIIATASDEGVVVLWDVATGRHLRTVVDPATDPKRNLTARRTTPIVRFHPATGLLLFGTGDRAIAALDLSGSGSPRTFLRGPAPLRALAFDRAGRRMAAAWGDHQVGLYDAVNGRLERRVHIPSLLAERPGRLEPRRLPVRDRRAPRRRHSPRRPPRPLDNGPRPQTRDQPRRDP